ncbi:MAG: transglutaminase family protein [Mycobacteriales bacterium]
MTWRIAVAHTTGYRYSQPVRASYNEARMTPVSGGGQQTLEARIEVTPAVRPLRYVDYWGAQVHAFDVHVPHSELVVTATSIVETAGARAHRGDAGWDELRSPQLRDRYSELLAPSRYVIAEAEVTAHALELSAAHAPDAAGQAAAHWAHEQLAYERGWTGVHTTSDDARASGKGVCQDYAHLTLAALRAMGLPARYVSGYLCPVVDAAIGTSTRGESHAWVEYWAGSWIAVDPTSLRDVAERHVVVARGRDYADVRPLSGVYHGPPASALGVTVELTRLQ